MKSTGIIRRIDDLGRIVIPKEIRTTLRIQSGDNLEIYITNNEIILKKYSLIKESKIISDFISETISSITEKDILIANNDEYISISGSLKTTYQNKNISNYIKGVINNRMQVLEPDNKPIELINDMFEQGSYALSTIIANGDTIGIVIMISKTKKINSTDFSIVKMISQFLSKYIEQ